MKAIRLAPLEAPDFVHRRHLIFDAAILTYVRSGSEVRQHRSPAAWRPRPGVGVGINVSDIDLAHQIPAVGPSAAGSPSANPFFVELPGRNEVCALFARRIDKRREAR